MLTETAPQEPSVAPHCQWDQLAFQPKPVLTPPAPNHLPWRDNVWSWLLSYAQGLSPQWESLFHCVGFIPLSKIVCLPASLLPYPLSPPSVRFSVLIRPISQVWLGLAGEHPWGMA